MNKFNNVLQKKTDEMKATSQMPIHHGEVHHADFHQALSNAMGSSPKVKEFVHLYEPHEYAGMKTFLSPDKASGYAIKPDGDIVSVFSTAKGRGDHIMQQAIKNGGSKLDAFDGYLPQFYSKHGFKEYHREKNWTPGGPDVVFMQLPHAGQGKLATSENYQFALTKSEFYRNSMSLSKVEGLNKSEMLNSGDLIMAYDGDNAGRLVGRAILADDPEALHETSNRIVHGHEIVRDWVSSHGGVIISGGGDEGTFSIPQDALHEIEQLRSDYQYATGLTMTVGVGHSLSEAGKALMAGKFRGKDQVCIYDKSVDQELNQAQNRVASGEGSEEERKLTDAYLDREQEGTNMNQSEESHEDCPYCAELAQDNVVDEDHCKYCHDLQSDSEPHCEYCAEAEQREAQDHEHSGDDCEYCKQAEQGTQYDHDHSGDDCEYCAQAGQDAPMNQEAQPNVASIENQGPSEDISDEFVSPEDTLAELDQQVPDAGEADMEVPQDESAQQPGDMGLAEEEVPDQGPDLSEVLQGGLDAHSDNIKREKVVQMVSQALEGFKACKPIIERAQEQAPQLYDASLAMLKAMIEMAKMLGLADEDQQNPIEEQPQEQQPQGQVDPTMSTAIQADEGGDPAGKPMGR